MSELDYAAPSTPPPPPPAGPPSFDFTKPFTFVFEDPRWLNKILIGGLFQLASAALVGVPFVLGYLARLIRNVVNGDATPLPEWDDLGEYFSEGIRLFGVLFIYTLPVLVLLMLVFVPMIVAGVSESDILRNLSSGIGGCVSCLMFPLSLALLFWVPAALLMAVTTRDFAAAFDYRRIWGFMRANVANYLIAIVIYLVARFVGQLGCMLFCVGIFFTMFWAMCVAAYGYAQAYRMATVR